MSTTIPNRGLLQSPTCGHGANGQHAFGLLESIPLTRPIYEYKLRGVGLCNNHASTINGSYREEITHYPLAVPHPLPGRLFPHPRKRPHLSGGRPSRF